LRTLAQECPDHHSRAMAADEPGTVEPVLQPPLPLAVRTAAHCFDVQFHPRQPLLAAATITGEIELHKFDADAGTSEMLRSLSSHKDSCRTARFLPAGDAVDGSGVHIASASASCFTAVTDVESGKKNVEGETCCCRQCLVAA